jgi:hypothetical protein
VCDGCHLLLLFLALFLVISLLSEILKHVLNIVLSLTIVALVVVQRELPYVVLLEHITLSEGAHGHNSVILDRPDPGHAIHRSCEDDWRVCLLDVLHSLDNVFVCLPLSYLDELEFFQKRLYFWIFVITGMVAVIVSAHSCGYFCSVYSKHSPWISLEISSD